ncbi:MAG: ribonuclease Y [bacterium]|nr:ribonuclease Y [bacterium]
MFISACFLGYLLRIVISRFQKKSYERQARKIVDEAEREANAKKKEARIEAKEEMHRTMAEFDKETKERKQELLLLEKRVMQKEENLDKKVDFIDKKDAELKRKEQSIADRDMHLKEQIKKMEGLMEEQKTKLQQISGLSKDEAKKILLSSLEDEVRHEAAALIRRVETETKDKSEKEAKKIISLAIQRCAADHVSETTISTVSLPNDEMKGRIIGREGRNIRALEAATGVDVIIDDTPEAVILSGFDNIRKEVARISLERLIVDGRIHPARIEEMVEKVRKEIDEQIREAGEQIAFDVGIHGLHQEEVRLLGRLKYRTSYGQNVYDHSKEVASIMGVMASELGIDVQLAKRAGLLHDIGKAVDHEVEGSHAQIGADLGKKFNEKEIVVNAIAAHHGDEDPKSVIAILVQAADAISAARPGARSETLEAYIKRLEKLEEIANSFRGVEKSYAIQAGREIRVMVEPDKVDDSEAVLLARNITKKVQDELEYPGQVKVTVIRETRAVEYAK